MKVKIGITIYRVEFTHSPNNPGFMTNVFGRVRDFVGMTMCQIFKQCAGNDLLRASCGTAYQNEADEYNKERGRKVALAKALESFSKKHRTKFWKAYLAR